MGLLFVYLRFLCLKEERQELVRVAKEISNTGCNVLLVQKSADRDATDS